MATTKPGWGIELAGHAFDLAIWEEMLRPPSDPWLSRVGDRFVLRWSKFDVLIDAAEVVEGAPLIVAQLNGAIQVIRQTAPVIAGCMIEFQADGTQQVDNRARLFCDGVVVDPGFMRGRRNWPDHSNREPGT
jgi:hypothetical protein